MNVMSSPYEREIPSDYGLFPALRDFITPGKTFELLLSQLISGILHLFGFNFERGDGSLFLPSS